MSLFNYLLYCLINSLPAVFGFIHQDGRISLDAFTLSESEERHIMRVGFIKGAFSDYYYQANVIATGGTASEF